MKNKWAAVLFELGLIYFTVCTSPNMSSVNGTPKNENQAFLMASTATRLSTDNACWDCYGQPSSTIAWSVCSEDGLPATPASEVKQPITQKFDMQSRTRLED